MSQKFTLKHLLVTTILLGEVFVPNLIGATFSAETSVDHKLYRPYVRNPHVPPDVWDHLTPYFLPENHPLRAKLDKLFSTRITINVDTLRAAGFEKPRQMKYTSIVVGKHKMLKGYLLKMLTDENPDTTDWVQWKKRIHGASIIKRAIEQHGYERMFKVPQKWIYPLPADPSPGPEYFRKNFILVVEDMRILKKWTNLEEWMNLEMTPEKLEALYVLITELGLDDSVYPWNVPFRKDGYLAFVDTERFHRWPVPYDNLLRYVAADMQKFWRELVNNGRN